MLKYHIRGQCWIKIYRSWPEYSDAINSGVARVILGRCCVSCIEDYKYYTLIYIQRYERTYIAPSEGIKNYGNPIYHINIKIKQLYW